MSRWRNTAMLNILKYSTENGDHTIAAKEWEFTGKVIDRLTSNNLCQLCEGKNLRYHLEINNKIDQGSSLLVGSSCIKRFDITVFDENGKEIFGAKKSSFLQRKIEHKKHEIMIDTDRSLWKVSAPEERRTIEFYMDDYKTQKGFSPDNLNGLLSLLEKHKLDYTTIFFKVSLRTKFELNSLIEMPDQERSRILPFLSVSQKKRFYKKKQINGEQDLKLRKKSKMLGYDLPSLEHKTNRNSWQLRSIKQRRIPNTESEQFPLSDNAICSICGELKRWATLNPNVCKECLKQKHRK